MAAFESKYIWRKGFYCKTSADVVGGVLEEIIEKHGSVTSALFLEESRDPLSQTHDLFEWDDAVAGEMYRLAQSRRYINCIEINKSPHTDIPQPAFLNVEIKAFGNTASYVNTGVALTDEEYKRNVLRNALSELNSFRRKYERLEELSQIFSSIEELEKRMEGI